MSPQELQRLVDPERAALDDAREKVEALAKMAGVQHDLNLMDELCEVYANEGAHAAIHWASDFLRSIEDDQPARIRLLEGKVASLDARQAAHARGEEVF